MCAIWKCFKLWTKDRIRMQAADVASRYRTCCRSMARLGPPCQYAGSKRPRCDLGSHKMTLYVRWFVAAAGALPLMQSPAHAETLGVFTKSAGNPIARSVRAGAEAVAKANGFTVINYIPTSPDNVPQQTA